MEETLLRHVQPDSGPHRRARFTLYDTTILEARLLLLIANHNLPVFDDPRIGREIGLIRFLRFGSGAHFCLGAHARMEARRPPARTSDPHAEADDDNVVRVHLPATSDLPTLGLISVQACNATLLNLTPPMDHRRRRRIINIGAATATELRRLQLWSP